MNLYVIFSWFHLVSVDLEGLFTINANGWCKYSLVTGASQKPLGFSTWHVLLPFCKRCVNPNIIYTLLSTLAQEPIIYWSFSVRKMTPRTGLLYEVWPCGKCLASLLAMAITAKAEYKFLM